MPSRPTNSPLLLCVLPPERASLVSVVSAAGGTPVLDLVSSRAAVRVQGDTWIRTRRRKGLPGHGPVILAAGEEPLPIKNRETWLEVTEPGPVPDGIAGLVLRGAEVGGPCGGASGRELLARMPEGVAVVLDAGLQPEQARAAIEAGAAGVVVSDLLLGLPELELPPRLAARLRAAEAASSHVVNGFRLQSSPLAPVLRRLLGGAPFFEQSEGWFSADDPAEVAWPAGLALADAAALAATFDSLAGLVGAYSAALLGLSVRRSLRAVAPRSQDGVAIIGLGCRLPGAESVAEFWSNILGGVSSIVEVPTERWDPALFWDPDHSSPDKTYAKIGGFLTRFTFNPRRFRIPPSVAKQVDPVQQTALESVADALQDAGYKLEAKGEGRDFDRGRTAVILGNSMGGEVTDDYALRVRYPAIRKALAEIPGFAALPDPTRAGILSAFEEAFKRELPTINEDSMPGELSNVIAGRVANAFDLTGPNFTVDAACASSLAAIQTAVKGLQDGDFDMALTGGADRSMAVPTYVKFCKIGALSGSHSAPFDESADGFVMGEGCGVLLLKRLGDAVRDGDRIYAVIKGIGASSDGKGKGITAPNPAGQHLALRRAYAEAGFDPVEVDLVECHGTSTVVGDKVEVEALTEVIGAGRRGARGPIRIGSVKSNIGHLKSAAGAASVIKTALAVFHGVLPPTLNFRRARAGVPFTAVPLQVQTAAEPWPSRGLRRAGVSAFGFGGTNFHVVLEEHRAAGSAAPLVEEALSERIVAPEVLVPRGWPVPEGVWAVSGESQEEVLHALQRGLDPARPFDPGAPVRIAASAADPVERQEQLDRAIKVLGKGQSLDLLRSRGISIEDEPVNKKLAFLFTGQGSQYIDMGLDLAARWPIVKETFDIADAVMLPELGRPLTTFIRRDPSLSEDDQFERLRATEISQPATLTVDVAILRLLAAFGVTPDMVAGHSLGEYAAAVAAGVLSFEDALIAVSARGREMAAVKIDDKGQMAGVATSVETVREVLAEIPGYVIAANKNCPSQTVIAGETEAVEAAVEAFRSRGITVYPLPVSHAFHSRIVAPASGPLRKVLDRLDIHEPRRPFTTNVTSRYYPTGEGARTAIIDILAQQVAAPVEWIAQVERMYADGASIFVECGPKRALTGFVVSILKRRPHRAIYTNHPKRGGVQSIHDTLAALLTLGFPVRAEAARPPIDIFGPMAPRLATTEAMAARGSLPSATSTGPSEPVKPAPAEATDYVVAQILEIAAQLTGYKAEELSQDDELEADLGVDTVKQAELVARVRDHFRLEHDSGFRLAEYRTLRDLANYAARRLGVARTPGRPSPARPSLPSAASAPPPVARASALPAPIPVALPTVSAELLRTFVEGAVRAGLEPAGAQALSQAVAPALQSFLTALVAALPEAARPATRPSAVTAAATVTAAAAATVTAASVAAPARVAAPAASPALVVAPAPAISVVATGASVGLPGGERVFDDENFQRILAGENRIRLLTDEAQDAFIGKNVVRLNKDSQTGEGTFHKVESRDQVIRLAGVKADFDLCRDYGVDPEWRRALDITTELAFAAGVEALKDAGIPLIRQWRETTTGKRVAGGWALPEALRDRTGVIFACAFPGYTNLLNHVAQNGDDGDGRFDRRFLFQILSMGHSQFAQFIGARGPNTQVNAACASTTQAISIAEDWIRAGRADRVVVVGADDVTNPTLLPWIGAGFLAAGAATTKDDVKEAALPFDRRRHGMILGMGAVGVVLEREDQARARGNTPIARLLASRLANSAFHGTRLDPAHIAAEMDALVGAATQASGVDRATFARQAMFMSHETFTPAKGGSAAAEIESLRRAFGAEARRIIIANTKGFTGHAMGAGIEDAVALKALQYGRVPPVPNLREPDPDLGDLSLSAGGDFPLRFAIRLAAGFGSQLAMAAWERVAVGESRVSDEGARARWLSQISKLPNPVLTVVSRTLRVEAGPEAAPAARVAAPPSAAPSVGAPPAGVAQTGPAVTQAAATQPAWSPEAVLDVLLDIIAVRTGYGKAELDPAYELEADLGIDTVKQAEIFGEVRDRFGLPREEGFKLSDYPTIQSLVGWVASRLAAAPGVSTTPVAPVLSSAPAAPVPSAAAAVAVAVVDRAAIEAAVLGIIARRTGYEAAELDPDFELEADLGIDTVKQAEVFGEVREHFQIPRDDRFKLSDYPTIKSLVGWLEGKLEAGAGEVAPPPAAAPSVVEPSVVEPSVVEPSVVEPSVVEPSVAPAAAAVVDRAAIEAAVLGIIARRTGYEAAELDPDFELEADLGIDTVKQAEVFGEVREHFQIPRDDRFKLSDYPTIKSLVGWLEGKLAAAAAEVAPPAAEVPPPASDDLRSPWQELPSAAVEPASASILPVTPLHPVPLAEPPRKVLPAGFRLRRPVLVPRAIFPRRGELGGLVVQVLGDGAFATALRAELQGRGAALSGKVDVVIDLSTDVLTGFQIARSLDAERPRHWLCATRLGADPSWSDPELALTSGARAGLCKALGREWPGTLARVVDLDPMLSDDAAARLLVGELGALDGAVEVYLDGDHRRVITLASEPLPPAGGGLRPNSLIVLSGGTRGITAEVAFELASRGPLRLVLLARSAPGEEPLVEALAKADIKAELEAGGGRATPGRIEARLKPLRAAEEARRTVARLRALGAEVSTLLCDLADGAAVQRALQQIRDEHGPIDGVIHGAGVEESRLLPDKDLEAFHRVFDGKALGGMALLRGLERDAFFVSMGSVAGRFGNAGQVDYSAANEAMARACLSRSGALHVDWTAWADVGMAVRGGMERLLTERGVELLPAGAGAGLLVDLVVGGVTGELVVAGRMGDFTVPALHPLLDHAELDGDTVIARRRLTLERDAWIGHHAIGGVPVLPGVIGLELMAAAATLVRPGQALVGAEDVRFLAPVKVHRDDPVELILRAEPDGGGVLVTLSSERLARTGRMLRTEHFRATLLLGEASPIAALPAAFFAEDPIDRDSIYARFFHGPLFQVLSDASAIAVDGLLADAEVNHVAFGGPLLTAPLVLEAAFQAAGLHRMAVAGFMALPSRIESLRWERLAADDSRLGIMVSTRKDGAYDVDVDGGGRAVLRLRGFHMIDTGPLPPGDAFPVPEGGWPRAVIGRTTKAGGGGELKALHPDEEAEIRRRGTPSRQADRRAGRRAARAAVEGLLGEADFVLRSRPSGAPEVTGIDPAPAVSITHTDGEALAVAVFGGRPGIDQEVVRLRAPSFAEDWFTEGERALTARDPWLETAVWTVKEAIQKALGAGMRVHPREVEVLGLVGRRASVRLHGEALRLHEEQGGGPVGALLTGLPTAGSGGPPVGDASGDKVVATTLLRAGAPVAAASSPSLRSIA